MRERGTSFTKVFAVAVALSLGCAKKEEPLPAPAAATPSPGAPETAAAPAHTGAQDGGATDGGMAMGAEGSPATGTGTVTGVVSFEGTPPPMQPLKRGSDAVCGKTQMNDEMVQVQDGKLANVVVRVKTALPKGAVPTEPVVVDQKDCMYRPRVQGAVAGQPIEIRNSDGTLHNVHTYEGSKTLFNQAQPPRAPPIVKVFQDGTGVVKFKCDVHPWMTGYVVVVGHPHFATTDAGGTFTLKDLPAGQHELEAWHEKYGAKTVRVEVKPNEAATVQLAYSAKDES